MRKSYDRGEKKKIKTFLVATNVVASRPPECRPTGTPIARAKITVDIVATNVIASQPPEWQRLQRRRSCQVSYTSETNTHHMTKSTEVIIEFDSNTKHFNY